MKDRQQRERVKMRYKQEEVKENTRDREWKNEIGKKREREKGRKIAIDITRKRDINRED